MTARIQLTQGYVALVDDDDLARVLALGRWQVSVCGRKLYASHGANRRTVRMHTFLTGWDFVDHRNGDGLDNRRANLRPATAAQNAANQQLSIANTTGYKGVSLYRNGRFRASIQRRHLGYFDTAADAARAYDAAALDLFGDFAHLNFERTKA